MQLPHLSELGSRVQAVLQNQCTRYYHRCEMCAPHAVVADEQVAITSKLVISHLQLQHTGARWQRTEFPPTSAAAQEQLKLYTNKVSSLMAVAHDLHLLGQRVHMVVSHELLLDGQTVHVDMVHLKRMMKVRSRATCLLVSLRSSTNIEEQSTYPPCYCPRLAAFARAQPCSKPRHFSQSCPNQAQQRQQILDCRSRFANHYLEPGV
jgi:hypothetical protein